MWCLTHVMRNRTTSCVLLVACLLFCVPTFSNAQDTTSTPDTTTPDTTTPDTTATDTTLLYDSLQAFLESQADYDSTSTYTVEDLFYSVYSVDTLQGYLDGTAAYDDLSIYATIWDLYAVMLYDPVLQPILDVSSGS